MSDVHALVGSDADNWTLVFHYPVADVNNSAGVSFRTALVNSGLNTTVMTVGTGAGQISTAEKTQLDNGEIFEHVIQFPVESTTSSTDAVEEAYNLNQVGVVTEMTRKLKYFGLTHDVP